MKASRILLALSLLASVCSAQEPKADVETPARKMDILFIAIDDMNDWTTVFDKNNPIQTPNLERWRHAGRSSRTPTAPHPVATHPAPRS